VLTYISDFILLYTSLEHFVMPSLKLDCICFAFCR